LRFGFADLSAGLAKQLAKPAISTGAAVKTPDWDVKNVRYQRAEKPTSWFCNWCGMKRNEVGTGNS
jgi:hypothetical protein